MPKFVTMEFPNDQIRLTPLFTQQDALNDIRSTSPDAPTPKKILDVYGEVCFPPAPADRPYLFASIVVSSDGKISFMDDRHGELIAQNNFRDPDGGLADFWVLNMLRFYADGVIIGARTLHTNEIMWANCFDTELAELRVPLLNKAYCPAHIVVSFDGTDIPFDHMLFGVDAQRIIATSPDGLTYVREHSGFDITEIGPFKTADDVDMDDVYAAAMAHPERILVIATGEGSATDGRALLKALRALHMQRIMVESPSYMTYLMSISAMDEMFMNYSSVFAGGSVGFGAFMHFPAANHPHSDFLQVSMHASNFLCTRQRMIYGLTRTE